MSSKRSSKCCEIVDSSPEANIVASKAGVRLCAAVSNHSCRTALKITRTCYIVFLSLPKPLAFRQDRVPQPFGYIRDINTHQSTDPKIYIQKILPYSFMSIYIFQLAPSKTKCPIFFLILPSNIPSLLGKYSIILLACECKGG